MLVIRNLKMKRIIDEGGRGVAAKKGIRSKSATGIACRFLSGSQRGRRHINQFTNVAATRLSI